VLTHIELLYRVSSITSSALNLDGMLESLIGLAVDVTRCDACLVYLLEGEPGEVVLRASQLPHTAEVGNLRMKLGEGVTGWVAEHRSVVALGQRAFADPRFKLFPALVEDTYQALLSVPLVSGGETIGVITLHHREAHQHAAEEIALMTFLGEQMGGVIARARLEDETEDLKRQLETRKLVERAKGILQRNHGLTEEAAYFRLRNESRRTRRPLGELAQAIILTDSVVRQDPPTA